VNLQENKVARILGKVESTERFLRVALYQGGRTRGVKKIANIANSQDAKAPAFDPTILACAFKKQRLFLFRYHFLAWKLPYPDCSREFTATCSLIAYSAVLLVLCCRRHSGRGVYITAVSIPISCVHFNVRVPHPIQYCTCACSV